MIGGQGQVAARHPLDVGAELGLEAAPDAIGLHHERELVGIPPLLADEAPVLARLLAVDRGTFRDGDAHAPPGEEVGGRAPDDPRADDDDVRFALHRVRHSE